MVVNTASACMAWQAWEFIRRIPTARSVTVLDGRGAWQRCVRDTVDPLGPQFVFVMVWNCGE